MLAPICPAGTVRLRVSCSVPEGLPDTASYPVLVARLLSRPGWSEHDVSQLVGLNFLRVFRRVEEVRQGLQEGGAGDEGSSGGWSR